MSGYRQSNYDPNWGWEELGPPARPYNAAQWFGVLLAVAGLAIFLAYAAGRLGLVPRVLDSPSPATALFLVAVVLINSRRRPATDPAPELAADRKRWMIITALVCAVVLGAAAVIEFSGAN